MTEAGDKNSIGTRTSVVVSCLHCKCRMVVYAVTLQDLAQQVSVSLGKHLDDSHPELRSEDN